MAEQFNAAGLPAACIVGTTDPEERRRAPARLRSGELCALVTVDLYNEGVDSPEVDTLLLLRPTQSPVVFQQQIGRGLRLAPGKESCLVLDFVGQHRADFRFDRLLGSLTGLTRRQLEQSVEQGFGLLPAGCHLQLQKRTSEQVLRNLRSVAGQRWSRLATELASYSALQGPSNVSLSTFVRDQALELDDIYREGANAGWTNLKRAAGLLPPNASPDEAYLSRRLGDLLHTDDPGQIETLRAIAVSAANAAVDPRRAQMLTYQIDSTRAAIDQTEFRARLAAHPPVLQELSELSDVLEARSELSTAPVPGLEDAPLCLHAAYSLREVLTAVGWLAADRRPPFQAGVLRLHERKVELMFVTLDKSEGFHDRVAYKDYAISRELFHWQTQNPTGPDTPAGRLYLESATNGWCFQLFVRSGKRHPYRACGPVTLVEASGDRPMSITWRLLKPLPARLFAEFSVLKAG
jgi:hypothetical protein